MAKDKFIYSLRSKGDLAGVLECDYESDFFYLYSQTDPARTCIVGAIALNDIVADIDESKLSVRWNASETKVGLFHLADLLAMFDTSSVTEKGNHFEGHILQNLRSNKNFHS